MAEGGLGGMGRQHSCLHAVPKNEIEEALVYHLLMPAAPAPSSAVGLTPSPLFCRRGLRSENEHMTSRGSVDHCETTLHPEAVVAASKVWVHKCARPEDHRRHGRRAGALPARTGP